MRISEEDPPRDDFDNFNKWYNNMVDQPQDNRIDDVSIAQQSNGFILKRRDSDNSEEVPYRQYADDLDDNMDHSMRVAKRKQQTRQQLRDPDQARELFNDLWRPDSAERASSPDPKNQTNQTGFVSAKTGYGDQKVSIFPASRRNQHDDND